MATRTNNVSGLAELDKVLQQLPVRVEANVLRGGIRAGSNVLRDKARDKAPVKSGKLRRSIRTSVQIKKGKVIGTVRVNDPKGHLIEFGTARHLIKPKEREAVAFNGVVRESFVHPGSKPQPYLRPALDEGHGEAVNATAAYVRKRLPVEFKKRGARIKDGGDD